MGQKPKRFPYSNASISVFPSVFFMAGPGRPKKTEKYGRHIVEAEDLIADRLPELVENLFVLAGGVRVQEENANGGVYTYTKPPDYKSNEYLINRIMGKPTERYEHDFSGLSDDELIARVQGLAVGDGPARPDPGRDED
jgi:hypothetical protein